MFISIMYNVLFINQAVMSIQALKIHKIRRNFEFQLQGTVISFMLAGGTYHVNSYTFASHSLRLRCDKGQFVEVRMVMK